MENMVEQLKTRGFTALGQSGIYEKKLESTKGVPGILRANTKSKRAVFTTEDDSYEAYSEVPELAEVQKLLGYEIEKPSMGRKLKEAMEKGAAPAKETTPAKQNPSEVVPASKNMPTTIKKPIPSGDYKALLQAPFKADEIEWRIGSTTQDKSKGLAMPYVTNRAIQNRLDEIFGPFGWRNEFKLWKADSQLCGISIRDPEMGEWVTKWDGADNSNMEAIKGGLSDAMKRCAYQWGIGRYLYEVPSVWVRLDASGRKMAETPRLPEWAVANEA